MQTPKHTVGVPASPNARINVLTGHRLARSATEVCIDR